MSELVILDVNGTLFSRVHPWDIHGARQAGPAAAWVGRAGQPYPDAFSAPAVQARSFDSAVERVLASADA